MITAAVVAIIAGLVWVFDRALGIRREIKIAKAEDSHADAKKVVDTKTTDVLIDDFNKRYPGKGADDAKNGKD